MHAQGSTDTLTASAADAVSTIFDDLYRPDSVVSLKMELDLERFLENKDIDAYYPAILHFRDVADQKVSWPIEIKARGRSRRQFCDFPPLKLRFFSDDLATKQLANFNQFKMVTHCRKSVDIRKIVLKEYLVYRIWQLLSENSFRVQLFEVTYRDIRQADRTFQAYAFLLEDEAHVAARLQGEVVQQRGALSKYIDQEELTFLALFQYFIGNTDWLVDRQHNIKFVKCPAALKLKILPYDFDACGLVGAAYAIPASHLPIEAVQERLFLGDCVSPEAFEQGLTIFREKKTAIFDLIRQFEPLDQRSRKIMIRYLEQFYRAIDKANFIDKVLLKECLGTEKQTGR
ncbi:MAG: hypothetical protein AAGD05_00640 [Bacteroidota bacterium]